MASLDQEMNNHNKMIRIFLIPYLARGHLIPMTDFACLLARAHPDMEPTVVLTPSNAAFIKSTLNATSAVKLLTYTFPALGSSSGSETVGAGSATDSSNIEKSFNLARPAHEELLVKHKPDAIVADPHLWWVTPIALKLGIPQLFFMASGSFPCVVLTKIYAMEPLVKLPNVIQVPDLPSPEISIPISEIMDFALPKPEYVNAKMKLRKLHELCFGHVVNTFYELEPDYCEEYKRARKRGAYFIGPVSLAHKEDHQKGTHGGDGDFSCLRWLDGKVEGSVVFISFGSQSYFKAAQLEELAVGLENSGKNFVWVVRGVDSMDQPWMPEGWEERVEERGLIIKGWAPQVAILAHKAIGAFLTHCGWNSIIESVTTGIPLLTWPLDHEQFINERLVVEVMGFGKRVWDGGKRSLKEDEKDLVPSEVITEAVSKFMKNGGEGEKARLIARELANKAKAAVAEDGSSRKDLNSLINDLIEAIRNKA